MLWRANGYVVCGDFPSGNCRINPSHAGVDVFSLFTVSSYSKVSTSTISISLSHATIVRPVGIEPSRAWLAVAASAPFTTWAWVVAVSGLDLVRDGIGESAVR